MANSNARLCWGTRIGVSRNPDVRLVSRAVPKHVIREGVAEDTLRTTPTNRSVRSSSIDLPANDCMCRKSLRSERRDRANTRSSYLPEASAEGSACVYIYIYI